MVDEAIEIGGAARIPQVSVRKLYTDSYCGLEFELVDEGGVSLSGEVEFHFSGVVV